MPTGAETLLIQLSGADARPISVPAPDDLRFSSATQRGYDQASFTLRLPTRPYAAPAALAALTTVRVVDRRSGDTVWYGRIDDPGLTGGPSGSTWAVKASGPGHELARISKQIVYIDRDPNSWRPTNRWPTSKPSLLEGSNSLFSHASDPLAIDPAWAWEFPFPVNAQALVGSFDEIVYDRPKFSTGDPIRIVGIFGSNKGSYASTLVTLGLAIRNASTLQAIGGWNTTVFQTDVAAQQGVGAWTITDITEAIIRWSNTGASPQNFGGDNWHHWGNLTVACQRYTVDGTPIAATAHGMWCTPRDIVIDLLGQHLPDIVTPGLLSADNTGVIEHAAWWSGVAIGDVLDFVSQRDGGKRYWAVWDPEPGADLPRFDWTEWAGASGQRYVITTDQVPELDGGGDDITNNVRVIYAPAEGGIGSVNVSGAVAELDSAGLTRSVIVDATGKGIISDGQAETIGAGALSDANLARTSGRITVTGRILDADSGRAVDPWEVRPGATVLLSATPQQFTGDYGVAPDGQSVFRLTGTAYSVSSDAVELSLDGGGRSLVTRVRRDIRNPGGRRIAP